MSIKFTQIPGDLLVPGGYIEFDTSRAGTSKQSAMLYIGAKNGGIVGLNEITRIQTEKQAEEAFGADSQLFRMLSMALRHNNGVELHAAAVEAGTGTTSTSGTSATTSTSTTTTGTTSTSGTSTTGTVDLSALITAMGDERFDYIACPYHDLANLTKLRTECDRRWHAMLGMRTLVITVIDDDFTTIDTLTAAVNSSHICVLPVKDPADDLSLWLGVLTAIVADRLTNDPAAPLIDAELPELLPTAKNYTKREQNDMAHAGQGTWEEQGGKIYLKYLVTTYRTNARGEPDSVWRDVQVSEILKNLREQQIYRTMTKFAGYKLAKDASEYGAGQKIVDPVELRGFLFSLYADVFMREYGWVQDAETYLDNLLVEIDPDNFDRVNFQDVPTLIGQFRIFAGQTQFIDR